MSDIRQKSEGESGKHHLFILHQILRFLFQLDLNDRNLEVRCHILGSIPNLTLCWVSIVFFETFDNHGRYINIFNISILKFSFFFKIQGSFSLDFKGHLLLEWRSQGTHCHNKSGSILGVNSQQAVGFLGNTTSKKLNLSQRRAVIGMVFNCKF